VRTGSFGALAGLFLLDEFDDVDDEGLELAL
jgi:hypothetical protein